MRREIRDKRATLLRVPAVGWRETRVSQDAGRRLSRTDFSPVEVTCGHGLVRAAEVIRHLDRRLAPAAPLTRLIPVTSALKGSTSELSRARKGAVEAAYLAHAQLVHQLEGGFRSAGR